MRKLLFFCTFLILVIQVLLVSSCKHTGYIAQAPTIDTTSKSSIVVNNKVDVDTITLPADTSAFIRALFECDSNNQVVVTSLIQQIGERSSMILELTRPKNNNKAVAWVSRCKCDSLSIYHIMQSSDTTDRKQVEITKKIPYPVPAQNTWWEKFKIDYGGYALGAWLALLIIFILWIAWKIFKIATPQGAAVSAVESGIGLFGKLFRR